MPVIPPLRIHILGLGSIGGLMAVRLAQQHSVCAILKSPPPSHATEFISDGKAPLLRLGLRQSATKVASSIPASTVLIDWQLADDAEPIAYLLVATKSYQVDAAMSHVRDRCTEKTRIVLFQNGLGSHYQATDIYSDLCIYAATTTEAANRPCLSNDGWFSLIKHAASGLTRLGGITQPALETQDPLLQLAFTQAGIKTQTQPDIWSALWQKFSINCGINAYTAILDCTNGDILNNALFINSIEELCLELAMVLRAAGYAEAAELNAAAKLIDQRIRAVAVATSQNVSSMLQDIRAGRPTEIDAINGFLVKYAEQKGFSVPINEKLTQQVQEISLVQH